MSKRNNKFNRRKINTGNMYGSLNPGWGVEKGSKQVNKPWNKKKGNYSLAFSERFNGLTDKEMGLLTEYGKDLIANHSYISKNMVILEEFSYDLTPLKATTGYYAKVGKSIIGKLTIMKYPLNNSVSFVYQEKAPYKGSDSIYHLKTYSKDPYKAYKNSFKSSFKPKE